MVTQSKQLIELAASSVISRNSNCRGWARRCAGFGILTLTMMASSAHGGLIPTTTSGLLDFESGTSSSNQYTNNFRIPYTDALRTVGQTGPAAGNDYVFNNAVSGGGNTLVGIYDTTPSTTIDQNVFSTATPLTVRFDLRAAQKGNSFGVYFLDPAHETTTNQLALVNIDAENSNTGTADLFRFFSNGDISLANNVGTQQNVSTLSVSSGVDAGSGNFSTLTVTYSVSGTTPTITMKLGTATESFTYGAGTAIAAPEVAFRLNDGFTAAGTADLDNFIVAVPEPGAFGLMALTALPLLSGRRRRIESR